MSKKPPVEMSGALPAPKSASKAQHLNPAGAPTSSSTAHHHLQFTSKLQMLLPTEVTSSGPQSANPTSKDDPNEPPERITSLRPEISPTEPALSASEADDLCSAICARIWHTNLGRMFDKVVAADRRGQIDDRLYSQLLDFFYCFVPMVVVAPRSDPIVVRAGDLKTHRKIMNMVGPGRNMGPEKGPHRSHRWFSRPNVRAC